MPLSDYLPVWQSHKLVRASKINDVMADGTMVLSAIDPSTGEPARVKPADRMFAKYRPVPGDYYVVHADGFASIAPAAAFIDGYHPL